MAFKGRSQTPPEPAELSEERQSYFWSKVALPNEQGCMLWTGRHLPRGYGQMKISMKNAYAHRVSYTLAYGPIPAGLVIDHLCRVPACVRPDHLEAVTQAENVRRGDSNAHNKAKTHCPQGHPYSGENLTRDKNGARRCRTCRWQQSTFRAGRKEGMS